jgi:transcriptional regulator with XRE-family HTH domain
MPGERLSMRKIREVLRLRLGQGLPQRAVAESLGLSQGAVNSYMARARRAGLGWPLPDGLDDAGLEVRVPVDLEHRFRLIVNTQSS